MRGWMALAALLGLGCNQTSVNCGYDIGGVDVCIDNNGTAAYCRSVGGEVIGDALSESCADAGFTVDCEGRLVQSGTLEDSSGDIVEGGGEADITSYYAYAAASQEDCDATDGQAIE